MPHFDFAKLREIVKRMRCIFKAKLLCSEPRETERGILLKLIYIPFHKKIITNGPVKQSLGRLGSWLSPNYPRGTGRW
jgi:hypothetical protein